MESRTKLLLIEDNPGDARLMQIMINEAGAHLFQVDWVTRLEEGLNKLRNEEGYAAVLVDLTLPDSEGEDTIQRTLAAAPNTPVIIMTGFEDEILASRAMRRGVEDYLVKGQADGRLIYRSIRYAIQRKKLVRELREGQERYQLLAENIRDVVWRSDLQANLIDITPSVEQMLGYTPEEICRLGYAATTPEPSQKVYDQVYAEANRPENLEKAASGGLSWTFEVQLLHKDGSPRWVEERVVYLLDETRCLIGLLGVARDITERKKADQKTRIMDQRFRAAFQRAPFLMAIFDPDLKYEYINQVALDQFNLKDESGILGKPLGSIRQVVNLEEFSDSIRATLVDGRMRQLILRIIHQNQEYKVQCYLSPLPDDEGNLTRVLAAGYDITERLRWEEELKISHARYQAIVEDQTELVCRFLADGTLTFTNQAYCKYFGCTREQLVNTKFFPQIYPDDIDLVTKKIASITAENPVVTYEYRVYNAEGEVRWQQWTDRAILNDQGELIEFQSVGRDITEQKQAEMDMERMNAALRELSVRDPLTGLHNRRYLVEYIEASIARAARDGGSIGIVMMDIDHFKQYNDTYGHTAGDLLLKQLGSLMLSNMRQGDAACRYGGEEFVLVMPGASLNAATNRANQLSRLIRELHIEHHGQVLKNITVSVGTAAYPRDGKTLDDLLKAADAALYRAKEQGRDRVVSTEM